MFVFNYNVYKKCVCRLLVNQCNKYSLTSRTNFCSVGDRPVLLTSWTWRFLICQTSYWFLTHFAALLSPISGFSLVTSTERFSVSVPSRGLRRQLLAHLESLHVDIYVLHDLCFLSRSTFCIYNHTFRWSWWFCQSYP